MTQEQQSRETQATCWCGGGVGPAAHPLYGTCKRCGTQVLLRRLTPDELKAFYSQGYWHEFVQNTYKLPTIEERAVNDFYDRIPFYFSMLLRYAALPKTLLEIGCSHGGFLYYCHKNGVATVDGIEVDANICAFARQRFCLKSVIPGFFPDVTLPRERYDVVAGFDVLEHFLDPIAVMSSVGDRLGGGGICFFLTPCYRGEDQTWDRYRPDEHTFLFTENSVRDLYGRSGLEVIDILPGLYSQDMFIVGRKKTASSSSVPAGSQVLPGQTAGPTVSVIVTTRNRPDMLDEALSGLSQQTYKARSVIVANAGAMDVTAVVEKYHDSLPLRTLSCGPGSSDGAARNQGIAAAEGDAIGFVNDTERLFPNHLDVLVQTIDKSDCMAVYSDSYRALQVVRGPSYFTFRRDLVFAHEFDPQHLLFENLFPLPCALVRAACFKSIGPFDETLDWCSDWDFWIRVSRKYRAQHVKRITCEYLYRVDGTLLSASQRESFIRSQTAVFRRYSDASATHPCLSDPQRNRVPVERDPQLPYPRIDAFMTAIVRLVEQNDTKRAIHYYSAVRPIMPPSPDLEQFDTVMEKLLKKV
jgi:SAM-dependent methyltransferase